ncbi:MlaD family protein [Conexibacter woesei]|uniref:Mammalian cell entry related domain protein n=1 Tax=Conexibacter woesei (strain DSM 14684 / CCUG 47730 / CIP 108061 / JCM 11494 / NBRC 100937 / ID131577) TaxID=469383 RepID=D3F0X5_CONWI|nr:MlaD family protein [Conexibacter woesei]ADB50051.1 Mammalian cell entry related domain protein [Conexibacter woesei DSM 14684]
MKRILAIGLIVVAALAVVVFGTGAASDDSSYKVRAIFDNAGFLVSGEDVKASGVVIGSIDSLEVTPDKKAAVILNITDPAFKNFKQDARCAVRLQSLLGEKYVSCIPTQPKNPGDRPSPPLRKIEDGAGEGQYLLPVSHTSSPVDLDMLNNVMRLPERQRFSLILNEFGTGLAGSGDELRAVIRRANPALDEFDKVLRILADQNRVLAKLAEDGDVAVGPLAREADAISNFIDKAGKTAEATAERGDDLERNFALFPEFLRQLNPTMAQLENFSKSATPVFTDLRAAAPSINKIFEQLGPFSRAALPTLRTFGDAAEISRRALIAARPVIQDIDQLARATGPLARNLAVGLSDLERQRGIDRFMRTVYGFTGALNGFDSIGHYLRTHVIFEGQCLRYFTVTSGCDSNFRVRQIGEEDATASAATSDAPAPENKRSSDDMRLPQITLPAAKPDESSSSSTTADEAVAGQDTTANSQEDPRAGVLGYLLGSESVR